MNTPQAAYLLPGHPVDEADPDRIPVKIGDVVYLADIDRQGPGTTDIIAATIEPIYDHLPAAWTNISVTRLGPARITRIFTHRHLTLDEARNPDGGMFLLVHAQLIDTEHIGGFDRCVNLTPGYVPTEDQLRVMVALNGVVLPAGV